jgi:hypothetical protein
MGTGLIIPMREFLSRLARINDSTKKYTHLNLIEIAILGLILAILAG